MPRGTDFYTGLGLPTHGNTLMRGRTTADILTIEHSTVNQGNFLVLRDSPVSSLFPNATATDLDILRIDAGGSFVGVSTVVGDNVMQGMKRRIVDTSVTTALRVEDSGTLFVVSSLAVSTMTFELPTGSGVPGVYYDFWFSSRNIAAPIRIAASSLVAAQIHGVGQGTSVISTFAAIAAESTAGATFIRLAAATSLVWVMYPGGGFYSSGDSSFSNGGQWIVGSTT